jgi:hypothetical protein
MREERLTTRGMFVSKNLSFGNMDRSAYVYVKEHYEQTTEKTANNQRVH